MGRHCVVDKIVSYMGPDFPLFHEASDVWHLTDLVSREAMSLQGWDHLCDHGVDATDPSQCQLGLFAWMDVILGWIAQFAQLVSALCKFYDKWSRKMENKKFVNTNNGHKPSTLSRSRDTAKSGSFITWPRLLRTWSWCGRWRSRTN